jgi:hypothetical protein
MLDKRNGVCVYLEDVVGGEERVLGGDADGLGDIVVAGRLDLESDGGVEVALEEVQQIACVVCCPGEKSRAEKAAIFKP